MEVAISGPSKLAPDVVFALDISKNAMKTYEAHKKLIASAATETKVGDVRRLTDLPECDLLLGCYPCQSFSMGGRRSPDNDDKASLYLAFAKGLSNVECPLCPLSKMSQVWHG